MFTTDLLFDLLQTGINATANTISPVTYNFAGLSAEDLEITQEKRGSVFYYTLTLKFDDKHELYDVLKTRFKKQYVLKTYCEVDFKFKNGLLITTPKQETVTKEKVTIKVM